MSIVVAASPRPRPEVEVAVLGAFRARVDEDWQSPATRQIARVGTMLAGWPGEIVELDRLVAGVWGDRAPATVRNTLQVHVSHLRRLVGRSTVRGGADGYALDIAPDAVDAGQFVDAVHEAARLRRNEHFARAAEVLAQALDLWRGTPFSDVFDTDLTARRARLAEVRDQAREDLLECRLETCHDQFEIADVVAAAVELVTRQPLREKGHVLLVRALAAADRPAEASAAFEAARAHLRDALGLDPSRALVEVHARGLARDGSVLPRAMRIVRVVPAPGESGRDADPALAEAVARVRETVVDLGASLVTVVTSDPAWARAAAGAVGAALADDMPAGVVVIDAADAALAHVMECAGGSDPAGLAVVVAGWEPAVDDLAAAFAQAPRAVLVVVADRALGLGTEVVLWDAAPTTARAAVPTDRDRAHQQGA